MRNVKIIGTGTYLPQHRITPTELAKKMGRDEESLRKVGMKSRYYANSTETASYMGAKAAEQALKDANLTLEDIDLLICASGTMEMPIPCTAALIHKELKPTKPMPAYDINSTCLSFLTALDSISYMIEAKRYQNALIVSSEIASVGLNFQDLESAALFSDGAAACVLARSKDNSSSILTADMCTYSDGWEYCKIPGGGTGYSPVNWEPGKNEMFQFQMDGKKVFRIASQFLPSFIEDLLSKASTSMEEIDLVIPHQASLSAMNILQKKLNIRQEQIINLVEDYGNMIAASIPHALHYALREGRLQRGDRVLLVGTSAGISIGGVILDY